MNFLSLIERKRDGQTLSPGEIRAFVTAYTRGELPEYQVAAFLMAIYFRQLTAEETRALTSAMRDSGDVLVFPRDDRPVVDKHSTGGVGDKVSLPLAPLLACLGFRVPMISGRGLGITGGTLDKLESIPGFRTALTADELIAQVQKLGVAMGGQTQTMCPADRLLYGLRDVTGTVPSIPLITASILSKKLAEGISALVLDVKYGSAAFMKTLEQARELATVMTRIAAESGVRASALLTDMNAPLGQAAGNWLEVRESMACLEGRGPEDLQHLVIECAAQLLVLTERAPGLEAARAQAEGVLASGEPRQKWAEIVVAQGGDLAAFERKLQFDTTAAVVMDISSPIEGYIHGADAAVLGEVIRELGGGRLVKGAAIDHDVGLDRIRARGHVHPGDLLCRLHCRTSDQADAVSKRIREAFVIRPEPDSKPSLITEIIGT